MKEDLIFWAVVSVIGSTVMGLIAGWTILVVSYSIWYALLLPVLLMTVGLSLAGIEWITDKLGG